MRMVLPAASILALCGASLADSYTITTSMLDIFCSSNPYFSISGFGEQSQWPSQQPLVSLYPSNKEKNSHSDTAPTNLIFCQSSIKLLISHLFCLTSVFY